jgi:hypothetical protein
MNEARRPTCQVCARWRRNSPDAAWGDCLLFGEGNGVATEMDTCTAHASISAPIAKATHDIKTVDS